MKLGATKEKSTAKNSFAPRPVLGVGETRSDPRATKSYPRPPKSDPERPKTAQQAPTSSKSSTQIAVYHGDSLFVPCDALVASDRRQTLPPTLKDRPKRSQECAKSDPRDPTCRQKQATKNQNQQPPTTNNHQQRPTKKNSQQQPNTTKNNNHHRPPATIKNKQLPTTTHHRPQE